MIACKNKEAGIATFTLTEHQSVHTAEVSSMVMILGILVCYVNGDLNKDGAADSVVVMHDTLVNPTRYCLGIYLSGQTGLNLLLSTDSAITPQGNYSTGPYFDTIIIDKGILCINGEHLRGSFSHRFRYQNGNFKLVGFKDTESDGQGTITSVDYNLLTGKYIYEQEDYETDKVKRRNAAIYHLKQLPDLRSFKPYNIEIARLFFL